jgi:hypothetical protein
MLVKTLLSVIPRLDRGIQRNVLDYQVKLGDDRHCNKVYCQSKCGLHEVISFP